MKIILACVLGLLHSCTSFTFPTASQIHLKRPSSVVALKQTRSNEEYEALDRRSMFEKIVLGATSAFLSTSAAANAINLQQSPDDPKITHKVTFNVRISRADGTFYTKAEPDAPGIDNQVFTGSITLGLFGELAPNHVSRFLSYVDVPYSPADDNPLPTYARSQFQSLDQSTGLLTAGFSPGLHLTTFAGSSALEYGGRILSSKLWVDDFKEKKRLVHNRPGLLTHRDFDVLPEYGITTRAAPELNAAYTVFGTVLPTESSNAFLSRCVDLPTYSLDRPAASVGVENSPKTRAVEEVASSVYSFQKDFFRGAAKTFGDTRLDNVFEGKILRRVEVTSISFEKL
jgi:cyclophilin family peptidyl-prolyl cis-trans isomerase